MKKDIFSPQWPEGLESMKHYQVLCDDKGRNGGSWMALMIARDGDVHVSMQDWENMPEGHPTPFPAIRVRAWGGGGPNCRTHQALLWLAQAVRLDALDRSQGKL